MEITWTGIVGTICGVVIGSGIAFISSILKLRQDDKLDRRRIIINRLEESHTCLEKVKKAASLLTLSVIKKVEMKMEFENMIKEEVPIERLSMLIHFYAPTLTKDMQIVEEKFMELTRQVTHIIISDSSSDDEMCKRIIQCTKLTKEIATHASIIQKKLAELCSAILK